MSEPLFQQPTATHETTSMKKLKEVLTGAGEKDLAGIDQIIGKFKYMFVAAVASLGNLIANQVAKTGSAAPAAQAAETLANMVTEGAVTSPKKDATPQTPENTTPSMGA